MPELPEVETIRRRLVHQIGGRRVRAAHALSKRVVHGGSARDLEEKLDGAVVVDVKRRAKHLLIETDRGTLMIHLRLTGDLVVVKSDAERPKFTRLALDLDDGYTLAFTDGRHLGTARLVDDPAPLLAELGPEPLADSFTPAVLRARLLGKRPLKAALLDQTVVAGVGNIYADESLFRAKLSPLRPASSLSAQEAERLHEAILGALNDSIASLEIDHEGDIPWRWQNKTVASPFLVYDRGGEPCLRCGAKLRQLRVGGRTTVACPVCQSLSKAKKAKPRATAPTTTKKKRAPARAAKRPRKSSAGKRARAR